MIGSETAAGSIAWIEAALVIFFVVFLLITIVVLLRRRGHFDRAARIPLNDGAPEPDGWDRREGAET